MYRNEKIRGRQAELAWSNETLAENAGVNINTVSAVRAGKPVSVTTLQKVADALNLSLADLFTPKPENDVERLGTPQI